MGKVKQAIQEVEEEVVSMVGDTAFNLHTIQRLLPDRLKDNPFANDKDLVKQYYDKAIWEKDNEEKYLHD